MIDVVRRLVEHLWQSRPWQVLQHARRCPCAPVNAGIRAAMAAIPGDAWTPIRYPRAIWDDQLGAWVSDAEVAETQYTAFASR